MRIEAGNHFLSSHQSKGPSCVLHNNHHYPTMKSLALWMALPWVVAGQSSSSAKLDQPFTASFSKLEHAACVTLYHRNGRIGCGTESRSAQRGQLQYFEGDDLPETNEKYVAVIEDYMLRDGPISMLQQEVKNGLVQGILVLNSTDDNVEREVQWYSPEPKYPQGYGTPSAGVNYGNIQYQWNFMGSGIIQKDMYGLPMAFVVDSDVSKAIRNEAQDQSAQTDVVAEFNYYMGPEDMNSADCLAWHDASNDEWNPKCLPLGGTSVWAAAGPPPEAAGEGQAKPTFVVGAGMDSNGLFHDLVHGSSAAASNILTLLMAAKLVGQVGDEELDQLNYQIVFGLFQGESHGFLGSRSFFRDLANFQCNSGKVYATPKLEEKSEYACLDPLYPSLKFQQLGQVAGMLSLDQLGVVTNKGYFYVHADQNNDQVGAFVANVLNSQYIKTNNYQVAYSSAKENNNNGFPYPPTPLTSLLSVTEGAVGGAVLTGYEKALPKTMPYHSFLDSAYHHEISLKAIASAATIAARTAIATAYAGAGNNYNYAQAAQYAANVIPELDYENDALVALANCFLYNGECTDLREYASTRAKNEKGKTGYTVGEGYSLGQRPNYYTGVYNHYYGQPVVAVANKMYGRYDGEDYGKSDGDFVTMQPKAMENAIHGILDDFLGRGSADFQDNVKCKKQSDCANVEFCAYDGEEPTCTGGGVCVCSRANFHRALDEAIEPAANMAPGYFEVSENDAGISPMYTEPYWSSDVGVRVYRDVGPLPGLITLVIGAAGMAISLCASYNIRLSLKKQKLY